MGIPQAFKKVGFTQTKTSQFASFVLLSIKRLLQSASEELSDVLPEEVPPNLVQILLKQQGAKERLLIRDKKGKPAVHDVLIRPDRLPHLAHNATFAKQCLLVPAVAPKPLSQ